APAARDRRASVRHNQGADGSDTLPNEDAAMGCRRDGAARAGLQPHARHEHHGSQTAPGSNQDVGEELDRSTGRPARQGRPARGKSNNPCALPKRFDTTKTRCRHHECIIALGRNFIECRPRGKSLGHLAKVRTSVLDVAYEHGGPVDALPVVLLHGYPYDIRAFDDVATIINAAGFRTIVPYLRGYGPTRFLAADTLRSGEQAAIGQDLLELLDALQIRRAVLAGFDWGARAACIVAALWPERVRGLVTCAGYQIQNNSLSSKPVEPEQERRFWYQHYFQTERGRRG